MSNTSRREKAVALFKPDKDGRSNWVETSAFEPAGLPWSTNGNLRRGAPWNLTDITWETRRENEKARGRIIALRMTGWTDEPAFNQTIDKVIQSHFAGIPPICNLSLIPLSEQEGEIDHRYGYKAHPDYIALYAPGQQEPEDFQWIHRSINLKKRQLCKECVAMRRRPPHPELGFVEGTGELAAHYPCRGCYLAEPERYRLSPRPAT